MDEQTSEDRYLSDINGLSVIGNSTQQEWLDITQVHPFTVLK